MIGLDIISVSRIKAMVQRYGERFLKRVFTSEEIGYAARLKRPYETLAGRFAAKEAFMKAYGKRLPWREIKVLEDRGRPFIEYGSHIYKDVSITHEQAYAVSVVFTGGGDEVAYA